MKPGDIVEILARTMGFKVSSGVRGIVIRKAGIESDYDDELWEILVAGKVQKIHQHNLEKLNSLYSL